MRIIVVGAGGVGGVIGGLLARNGVEVAFIARGKQLEALRTNGLRIEGPRGTFQLTQVEVSDDPARLPAADVVLVAVKSWQVADMAHRLAPAVKSSGFAVPLENGIDAADKLVAALGQARVAGGFCAMLSWLEAPGLVRHAGGILRVVLGERGGGGSARLSALVEVMNAANIDASVVDDIEAASWEKFLFIAPFGAVGAVTRAAIGVVRTLPETRALLTAATQEVAELARARGVRIHAEAVARALAMIDAMQPDATASMQRDVQAGRPSELHDQVGAVVRMARERGMRVPCCEFLFASLLPQELEARDSASGL